MKIVIAMDSFKGSLSAERVCRIVADTVRSASPEVDVSVKPMADGGEGTAAALMAATGGQWIKVATMGPLPGMQVDAGFVWLSDERTALVEMAVASGLTLLEPSQQNPLKTTTYGTGQIIDAAIKHGAHRILLAIGGSATVDGGVGAAMALGWSFLDSSGREIALGGGELSQIARIIPPADQFRISDFGFQISGAGLPNPQSAIDNPQFGVPVDVLCDVDNPLCGEHGAARVYGPQKGATPRMVETLDAALSHLAQVVKEQLGRDVAHLPGAGAAGGLAAGAVAFMNAHLVSGIDEVMAVSHLREALADADWVITGEGKFDSQSLRGKVVSGVTRLARANGVKVAVIAGQVALSSDDYRPAGIEIALACKPDSMPLEAAIANAETLMAEAAGRFARTYLR